MQTMTRKISPQVGLMFDGRCEEAFAFYERSLNGRIEFMLRWGESPARNDAPPEWAGKIAHARLALGETILVGSDPLPGSFAPPRGFSFLINLSEPNEVERVFQALSQNGVVRMPLAQTWWSERFGVVVDKFGIQWDINCDKAGA